jgi:4-amino-4-deoxy-L-arabinose transferase-like glycosyltransferase
VRDTPSIEPIARLPHTPRLMTKENASERFRSWALWAVLALAFLLRLQASTDRFLHPWDERYHAVVAKNLIQDPLTPVLYADPVLPYDTKDWGGNHVWLHKPPFTLWLMALSLRLFGVTELAARLPSVLFSTLTVALVFAIGRRLFTEKIAILAASLAAINGYLIDMASGRAPTDHVDTMLVFLVTLGAFLSARYLDRGGLPLLLGIGVVTGLALLTKWLVALLIPALWLGFSRSREDWKRLVRGLVIVMAVAAPFGLAWRIYCVRAFPLEASFERGSLSNFTEAVEGHGESWTFYLDRLGRHHGELVYLPIAWLLWRLVRRKLTSRELAVAVWLLVPYLVFSLSVSKMPGYVAIAAPAVFLIVAMFWWQLRDWTRTAAPGMRRNAAYLGLALLLLLPVRYTVERLKVLGGYERSPAWAAELRSLDSRLGPGKGAIFNTPHPVEAMFYSSHPAYSPLPSKDQIATLTARGYRVWILDGSEVGQELRKDPRVVITPSSAR